MAGGIAGLALVAFLAEWWQLGARTRFESRVRQQKVLVRVALETDPTADAPAVAAQVASRVRDRIARLGLEAHSVRIALRLGRDWRPKQQGRAQPVA